MNELEMLECSMKPVDPILKDQLAQCISTGQSKKFLGKEMKLEDLDKLTNEEIEKLHAIHNNRLAATITKSLGDSLVRVYSHVACMILGIQGAEEPLIEDLSGDPFLNCAIRDISCKLYYKFGSLLSPLTLSMYTGKRYQEFKQKENNSDSKTDLDKAIVI